MWCCLYLIICNSGEILFLQIVVQALMDAQPALWMKAPQNVLHVLIPRRSLPPMANRVLVSGLSTALQGITTGQFPTTLSECYSFSQVLIGLFRDERFIRI